MKLRIADDMSLPLDAVTQTFLIVGKRGSGKSNTAARFVEQLYAAKLPFVVLDPVDTWWGLKASADGGRGLDVYVFGGSHKDLPLEAHGGALLAEVLCEHRISMVLSVKHLSGRERSAFMVAFAQTLFQKWTGGPLHVVLEEAHELAPQMSGGRGGRGNEDNEAAMLGAFKRLWKLGRASGIGGSAITQRPASLSKDITTQSEILIAHRTIGPQDVAAIGQWVKYHGEREDLLAELPSLPTGEAFVWAPEFPEGKPIGLQRTTVLRRETYDSASTPKVGERRVEPKDLAPVDLEKLRVKMAATIEKAKAEDPRELKKINADKDKIIKQLQTELSQGVHNMHPKVQPKVVEKPVINDAQIAAIDAQLGRLEAAIEKAATLLTKPFAAVREQLAALTAAVKSVRQPALPMASMPAMRAMPPAVAAFGRQFEAAARTEPRRQAPRPPVTAPAEGLTPKAQEIVNALAELQAVGAREPEKELVAIFAGYGNLRSKGFTNAIGALRSGGYIDYPANGRIALTAHGAAIATPSDVPRTPADVQRRIIQLLGAKSGEILQPLLDAYPHAVTREAVASAAGYEHLRSKGLVNALGRLRSLGFIDYPTPGTVAAKPVLFLEGT